MSKSVNTSILVIESTLNFKLNYLILSEVRSSVVMNTALDIGYLKATTEFRCDLELFRELHCQEVVKNTSSF
jgi:hypothetical protein